MKKLYLLIIMAILCLVLTGCMSQTSDPEIEALIQAVEMSPDDEGAHYNLGMGYGRSGKYKEAIEASVARP